MHTSCVVESFRILAQTVCLRVVECPPSSRVHIRRVWCRWNRGPPQRFTWLLKFELRAHILCSRKFSDLGQNMYLRAVECPPSRRVRIRQVWCRWNRGPPQRFTWLLKFEFRAQTCVVECFRSLGQTMYLRVIESPPSRRVHIRRVWCRWNRGPP